MSCVAAARLLMTADPDASVWNFLLDNPIDDGGHRFGCPKREGVGDCRCDRQYRLRRRIIMSVVSGVILAVLFLVIRWLAVYEPALGASIASFIGSFFFAMCGVVLFGMILFGIGTLLQKWLWR